MRQTGRQRSFPLMVGLVGLVALSLVGPVRAWAQEPQWRIGTSLFGDVKYQPGFTRFDYVNPDAPKGGEVKLSTTGTYDTFNPILEKGELVAGLDLVFETLLKKADDEVSTSYGLLAEAVAYPDDISQATFRLRAEATWADGSPVTPEDVIYSFEKSKELNPLYTAYYGHVVSAEKTGARDITFRFDEKNNRELPSILGQFLVVPKRWWEGKDASGKSRDIARTTLEPVMGSGPYRIAGFSAGATVTYERRDDYWGKDVNVNVGHNNFDRVIYTYFGDRDVEFEAFRSGNIDYWRENMASRWATGYDFPAVTDGRVKREELPNTFRATGVMQALVPNMRRAQFKDRRVREALNYAFDFEDLNRSQMYDAYKRIDSYFWNTELASSGLPEGDELKILNEIKDKVPPEVFTKPYVNPVGGNEKNVRTNLQKAIGLLREAGYQLKGNRMIEVATGKPLSFEILLGSPFLEPRTLHYANSLKRIGIEARVRTVDPSQYTNRTRAFDYDMTWSIWAESLTPGNEQADYWGSKAADRQGSKNYAGIADPAIDALINRVIFAKDRPELVAATRALDRVLLAGDYVVPLYYKNLDNIAYWDKVARPATLPDYAIGFPDIWWSTQATK